MQKILTVILILFAMQSFGQKLDIQFGAALPGGNFGNNDLNKTENGFATSGFSMGLQADYVLYKNMGITGKLSYSNFGFNTGSFETQLNARQVAGTTVTVEHNGGFNATAALAGGFISLGKKELTLDIRLMGGFVSLRNNGLTYTTSYAGQDYVQRSFSETDIAPAFGWGLTARYLFKHNIFLSLNLDNIYAGTTFNKNPYQSSSDNRISKPFQSYILAMGIGYAF